MFGFRFTMKPEAVQKINLAIRNTGANSIPAIALPCFLPCAPSTILRILNGLEISPNNKQRLDSKAQLLLGYKQLLLVDSLCVGAEHDHVVDVHPHVVHA